MILDASLRNGSVEVVWEIDRITVRQYSSLDTIELLLIFNIDLGYVLFIVM